MLLRSILPACPPVNAVGALYEMKDRGLLAFGDATYSGTFTATWSIRYKLDSTGVVFTGTITAQGTGGRKQMAKTAAAARAIIDLRKWSGPIFSPWYSTPC
jgi:hypothetical protein